MPSPRRRAVIFDLDGVLVDSEDLHVDAWKVLFAQEGIEATEAEFDAGIGMVDTEWIRGVLVRRGLPVDLEWWRDAKRGVFREILAANIRPYPGVAPLVHRLHVEFRLGVASNSWHENIETVLAGLGLGACFGSVVGLDDVTHHKPHPEAYLRSSELLGVPPAWCTVVEDSRLGIQAAKAAGMRCIGIPTTLAAEELSEADLVVGSLEEADAIVGFARQATEVN